MEQVELLGCEGQRVVYPAIHEKTPYGRIVRARDYRYIKYVQEELKKGD